MVNLIGDLRKAWDNPTMAVSIPVSGFDGKAFQPSPFAALQHLARHPAPACVWVASSAQSASMLGCVPFTSQPQQRPCGQAGTRRTRGASA